MIDNDNAGDQGDGRRPRLRHQALQPRHPGPPPAGLLDQAVHPGDGARTGHLARHRSIPHEERSSTFGKKRPGNLRRHNYEDSYLGASTSSARRPTRTTRSTRSSALEGLKGKTVRDRTGAIAGTIHKAGYDDPISTNPAMVLGGLDAGRHPARLDLRLLDDRQQRRAGQRHPGAAARRQPGRLHEVDQRRRRDDQGRRQGLQARAGLRPGNASTPRRASSKPSSPAAPAPTPRSAPKASGARPGRPRTTATPGSAAATRGSHRLRLGRLRRLGDADGDRLQRRPGGRRHLPGADLGAA